ncbi:MAG: hypothetical protein M3R63_18560 [Actinomycetota bacterium]|nr:hypothetical protein [Actinomycetota bacterium]
MKSADLNAIQDNIISAKHGDLTVSGPPDLLSAGGWTYVAAFPRIQSGGVGTGFLSLGPFRGGDRIKSVSLSVFGNGITDLVYDVIKSSALMVSTSLPGGSGTHLNQAAAWGTLTINITDYTIVNGDSIILSIAATAALYEIGSWQALFDHP